MSIKSDKWIKRMALESRLIDPFIDKQVKHTEEAGSTVSYGLSSYGYDVRCADEFKIFTNINSATVDPKNFDEDSFIDIISEVCVIPPNSFALARTVEYFKIPRIYANEGVAQMLFFESDELCETSYADRKGKYQGQLGVTPPKV